MKNQSMGLIYCAHNIFTGKKYIGQTKQQFNLRIKQHKKDTNRIDCLFYRAIKKYGWDCFIWGIIEECDLEKLNEKEEYWISYYKSNHKNYGYNMSSGGEFGIPREILCEIGKLNGKKAYENKIGIFSYTKEERIEISKNAGSKARDMGVGIHALTNKEKSFYGKIGGDVRAKQLEKSFTVLSPDGVVYNEINLTQFCKKHNLTPSALCNVLNNKYPHHKGWTKYEPSINT